MFRLGIISAFLVLMASHAFSAETEDMTDLATAAEADEVTPKLEGRPWNEFENDFLTMRFGYGFLVDTATYMQDEESRQQMDLEPKAYLRDLRFILKGRFKHAPRLSYSLGYMYDGNTEEWRFRQTGIMINVPEHNGDFFIGRTKETFSTSKIMVGYFGWTNERSTANDAFLPILADGLKWTGFGFGKKLVYSAGVFTNVMTPKVQSYAKNDHQVTAKAVWLPLKNTDSPSVLHLAMGLRHGVALQGNFQYRSKPESYSANTYAIDTGKFPGKASDMLGLEVYYQPGSLMFGSEYYWNQVTSAETQNPLFHGGEVFMSYLFTGEKHPYNERGYFNAVVPSRSAFAGGYGALEFVLRYSYSDLDSKLIQGGRFWRITPMFNWYLSEFVRLEFVYGYSELDRFDLRGNTQYFQTRFQFTL
ncbi:OprO/OprP family phosphate-selective porin [Bdellovibrio sp. HCB337]|uniref:OprO/OprP family phosphate-selective porin n=1 Tax=Bdellovibrio sp. HCB337 TaxID=3394358 RepID=UPI0039A539D5